MVEVGDIIDLVIPPEPPIGTILVDREGDRWKRTYQGWVLPSRYNTEKRLHAWTRVLSYAPLMVAEMSDG